jgi:hypothetical protein
VAHGRTADGDGGRAARPQASIAAKHQAAAHRIRTAAHHIKPYLNSSYKKSHDKPTRAAGGRGQLRQGRGAAANSQKKKKKKSYTCIIYMYFIIDTYYTYFP